MLSYPLKKENSPSYPSFFNYDAIESRSNPSTCPPWLKPGIYAEYVCVSPIAYPNFFHNKTEVKIKRLDLRWEILSVEEGVATLNLTVLMEAYVLLSPEPAGCCPELEERQVSRNFLLRVRLKDRVLLDKGKPWGKWNMWLNLPVDTQPPETATWNETMAVVKNWIDNVSMVTTKPTLKPPKWGPEPDVPYKKEHGEIPLDETFNWTISPQIILREDGEDIWQFYWAGFLVRSEGGRRVQRN